MIHSFAKMAAYAAGAIAVGSAGYFALCLWSATRFLCERKAAVEAARREEEGAACPAQSALPTRSGAPGGVADLSGPCAGLQSESAWTRR